MEITSMKVEPKYGVGTTYVTRGKSPRVCTVVDTYITHNLRGEVVKVRYVSAHEFLGQTVTNKDVCETTIAMGLQTHVQPV